MTDMKAAVEKVKGAGRYGDSVLMHVNPIEVEMLHNASPTGLTINPETGQPEAFLPILGALAGGFFGPSMFGAGTALGLSSLGATALGAGLGSFGGHLAQGDSFGRSLLGGVTSGALSYGVGSLFNGMSDAAASAISPTNAGTLANTGNVAGAGASPAFGGTGGIANYAGSPLALQEAASSISVPGGSLPTGSIGAPAAASNVIPNTANLSSSIQPGAPTFSSKLDAIQQAAALPDSGYGDLLSKGFARTDGLGKAALLTGGVGTLAGGLNQQPQFGQPQIPQPDEEPWIDEQFPTLRTRNTPPAGFRPGFDPEFANFAPIARPRNAAQGGLVRRGYARGGAVVPATPISSIDPLAGGQGVADAAALAQQPGAPGPLDRATAGLQQAQTQQPFAGTIGAAIPGGPLGQRLFQGNGLPSPQRPEDAGIIQGFN